MFGFSRQKQPKPPSPPWLKWVIIIFLLYVLAASQHPGLKSHDAIQQAAKELNPKNFVHLEEYKNLIFPSSPATLRIKERVQGEGSPAICGQEVAIAYDGFLPEEKTIGDSADKEHPLRFRLGEGKVMPAFQQGVMGMRKGGKRSLLAPPALAYGIKEFARADVPDNTAARFEVELLDVTPALAGLESAPFRIAHIKSGSGDIIGCGSPVKANITVFDIEGKKLFSTKDDGAKPLMFTPGKSEVFLGLEQGVIGMAPGGIRSLIVPPLFQKTMDGHATDMKIPFPAHQTVLVDVETLP